MSAIDPGDTGTVAGPSASRNATLVLGSVGVVYGDIGTSPIYAIREGIHAAGRGAQKVIGVVSLLLWMLVLIVTIKYVILILLG